ncbi:Hypothetical protein SRAE_X000209400 [Strongyloides ratti]|uniref:Uncharacterized protein n=1 Tax=Strongyloides ratti TaxID=34506 RepID=A0A090KSH3_STRRB|nr:Hypothetical protein SRAE_X000209400 [Strongyloides ratti]CEF60356.1 Hypothetical protein SRAE_X000209400 [Strongyloides ratti]
MKSILLFFLIVTFICLENTVISVNFEDSLKLNFLYARLKQKMEMIDKNMKLNKVKKDDNFNLQMLSKAATTIPPKPPANLRSSSYILNNILKAPLGSRLQV